MALKGLRTFDNPQKAGADDVNNKMLKIYFLMYKAPLNSLQLHFVSNGTSKRAKMAVKDKIVYVILIVEYFGL